MPRSIVKNFYWDQVAGSRRRDDSRDSFLGYYLRNIYCSNKEKYLIPGEIETEVPPYAVEFCTASGSEQVFAIADESGALSLFLADDRRHKTEENRLKPFCKLHVHNNAIFDIAWVPNEKLIATASGDQTSALWDVETQQVLTVFKGHSCSLKSVNVSKHDRNLFATGSRDGNALIWDQRTPTFPVVRIRDAHAVNDCLTPRRKRRRISSVDTGQLEIDSRQTVSCAIFQESHTVITSGAMNGTIKIWDLRKIAKKTGKSQKNVAKEEIAYPGLSQRRRGYTCLTMDDSSTDLFASCTDDSIYHYRLSTAVAKHATRKPVCVYRGHFNTSFYIRSALSPGNKFLISGSDDNRSYIWKVDGKQEQPELRLVSEGMSEVTAVAWCPYDFTKLVTCSDECVVRLWRLPYGDNSEAPSDVDGYAEALSRERAQPDFLPGFATTVVRRDSSIEEFQTNSEFTDYSTTAPAGAANFKLMQQRTLFKSNVASKLSSKMPSIDRWLVRKVCSDTAEKCGYQMPPLRKRTVNCLTNDAKKSPSGVTEGNGESKHQNKENLVGVFRVSTPNKNWLQQLSESRRRSPKSSIAEASTKGLMREQQSYCASRNNLTPVKAKSIQSYFDSSL